MILITKLFSIALIIMGCMFLLKNGSLEKNIDYFKQGNRLYVLGFGRLLIGVICMSASSMSRVVWIVFFVGLLIFVSGLIPFILKKDKTFLLLDTILNNPSDFYKKIICYTPIAIGVLLLCAI